MSFAQLAFGMKLGNAAVIVYGFASDHQIQEVVADGGPVVCQASSLWPSDHHAPRANRWGDDLHGGVVIGDDW